MSRLSAATIDKLDELEQSGRRRVNLLVRIEGITAAEARDVLDTLRHSNACSDMITLGMRATWTDLDDRGTYALRVHSRRVI